MLHRRPAQTGLIAAVILATTLRVSLAQSPVGSAFTYQGRLTLSGQPVSGATDFFVILWDGWTGGFPIGSSVELTHFPVIDGLFTLPLDFGADAFDGNARYLEIRVRHPAGLGSYQLLTPRQAVAPAPYAVLAQSMPGVGVDDNEQVGMGTDAPVTKLDIRAPTIPGKGQLALVDPDNPSTAAAALAALTGFGSDIGDVGDGRLWYMGSHSANNRDVLIQNTLASGRLRLATEGRAADVVLDSSGFLGLGTTTPTSPLTFKNADERKITFFENAGSGYFGMDLKQDVLSTWTGLAGAFAVGQHNPDGTFTERMRISGGGRVGIGTSTPLANLDVQNVLMAEKNPSDGNGELWANGPNGNLNAWIGHSFGEVDSGAMAIADANGTHRAGLFIESDGNGVLWANGSNGTLNA